MTTIRIENTGSPESILDELIVVVCDSKNVVHETHVLRGGLSRDIEVAADRYVSISERWRDATPPAPMAQDGGG